MKRLIRFAMVGTSAALLAGAALFIGCSDDNNVPPDGGGGPDGSTGTDTGTGMDGSKQDTGTQDTGTQDTGTGTDGGTDGGGGYQVNCQSYCTGMLAVCTGGMNAQYLDMATCTAMCAKMTVGDAGAMMGNTLACRVYHLNVASVSQANADTHCPHAGPYGFAQCGTECESFCALFAAQCGGGWGSVSCAQGCPNVTNPVNTSTSFLNAGGNTLDCREYHLENAYKAGDMNGTGHCAHATQDGGGICM